MTDKQILTEVIRKTGIEFYDGVRWELDELAIYLIGNGRVNQFILSHFFAKKFWGEERVGTGKFEHYYGGQDAWEYHLQQIILLPDNERIKYLEKFL